MHIDELSSLIIGAAMRVHTALGPGLLETVYQRCLIHELRKSNLLVIDQLGVPVVYDDICIDLGYRIDLLVNGRVVVEVKAVARLLPVHEAQLLSYLRLGGYKLGLLMNFHVAHMRDGVRRLVNDL